MRVFLLMLCACVWSLSQCQPRPGTCRTQDDCEIGAACKFGVCLGKVDFEVQVFDGQAPEPVAKPEPRPNQVICKWSCCDGTRHEKILDEAQCHNANETLTKSCPKGVSTIVRGLDLLWRRTTVCPGACNVRCCNGSLFAVEATQDQCSEQNPTVSNACKEHDGPMSILYQGNPVWAKPASTCKGACVVTCCDGSQKSTPDLLQKDCNQALARSACAEIKPVRAQFHQKVVWSQDSAIACQGSCQVTCCNKEAFSFSLPIEQCKLSNPNIASLCKGTRFEVEEIRFDQAQLYKKASPCQSLCTVGCCDGSTHVVSSLRGECTVSHPQAKSRFFDRCKGETFTRYVFENGKGWSNQSQCQLECFAPGQGCKDDGNPCTYDVCNDKGSCLHPAKKDGTVCGTPSKARRCCSGSCKDLRKDSNHCGGCGIKCDGKLKCFEYDPPVGSSTATCLGCKVDNDCKHSKSARKCIGFGFCSCTSSKGCASGQSCKHWGHGANYCTYE